MAERGHPDGLPTEADERKPSKPGVQSDGTVRLPEELLVHIQTLLPTYPHLESPTRFEQLGPVQSDRGACWSIILGLDTGLTPESGFDLMRRAASQFYKKRNTSLAPSLIWPPFSATPNSHLTMFHQIMQHSVQLVGRPLHPAFLNITILALGAKDVSAAEDLVNSLAVLLAQEPYRNTLRTLESLTELYFFGLGDVEDALLTQCGNCFNYPEARLRRLCVGLRVDYSTFVSMDGVESDYNELAPLGDLFAFCPLVHISVSHPGTLIGGILRNIDETSTSGPLGSAILVGDTTVALPVSMPDIETEVFTEDAIFLPSDLSVPTKKFWRTVLARGCALLVTDTTSTLGSTLQRADLVISIAFEGARLLAHCEHRGGEIWNISSRVWQPRMDPWGTSRQLCTEDPYVPLIGKETRRDVVWALSACYDELYTLTSPSYAQDIHSDIVITRAFNDDGSAFDSIILSLL
ncbi:hypothetical protein PENSPDRAFT_695299 [Peniophora sp. CONT]|nr:hypothetical protein PENSPDRAFT_695299 [Peniophora sp. CONT]